MICQFDTLTPDRQRLSAHDPRHRQPLDRTDRDEHQNEVPPKHDRQNNDEKDEGQGIENVHEPHHQVIDAPPKKAGRRPIENADQKRDQRRHEPDRQRNAAADHHPDEKVAAVRVCPEDVSFADRIRANLGLISKQPRQTQIVRRRARHALAVVGVVERMRPDHRHDDG
jgi:hypothetical protein